MERQVGFHRQPGGRGGVADPAVGEPPAGGSSCQSRSAGGGQGNRQSLFDWGPIGRFFRGRWCV